MHIPEYVRNIIRLALEEDVGHCDVTTTHIVLKGKKSRALIIAKGSFIVAGLPFVREVFDIYDKNAMLKVFFDDGSKVRKGDIIAEVYGDSATIIS